MKTILAKALRSQIYQSVGSPTLFFFFFFFLLKVLISLTNNENDYKWLYFKYKKLQKANLVVQTAKKIKKKLVEYNRTNLVN